MTNEIIRVLGGLVIIFLVLDFFFLGWVLVEEPILKQIETAVSVIYPAF